MANRILLLCACATSGLRQGRFPAHGAYDDLDARGRAAAHAAGPHLAHLAHPAHGAVFSSPAAAALQTAAALGLTPRVVAALRDTDYGQWRGRALKDVAREAPEHLRAWLTDVAVAPPAGESFMQVVARVDAWLDAQLAHALAETPAAPGHVEDLADASVLVVTHPAVIRASALRGTGMTPDAAARLDVAPLSVMALERRHDMREPGWKPRWVPSVAPPIEEPPR
ncbi:histidine phosphatase family protein [Robbsia sp. Bb-Pol-6]|uniref:Histidine phosphatase family protein n=1 Tax=Robbsia betulipollinis TaxID=2981849 RepID=A0ABT3ZSF2_9BURK|nr:histidine phosphatase family protein [Robbsia betulipollinis]MCY0389468.1 histidine phosphatase family protein [Robbsia betulipollinis]